MTDRDDILRMAQEAGFVDESFCRWGAYTDDLKRFAALVADRMIRNGYRKCAEGQRATQFCGQLESAVAGAYAAGAAAEREALAEANEAFGKRQVWWDNKMLALEAERDALLEALKAFANEIVPNNPNDPIWVNARAAIAKAEEA